MSYTYTFGNGYTVALDDDGQLDPPASNIPMTLVGSLSAEAAAVLADAVTELMNRIKELEQGIHSVWDTRELAPATSWTVDVDVTYRGSVTVQVDSQREAQNQAAALVRENQDLLPRSISAADNTARLPQWDIRGAHRS